jgi:hypothetical protein
MSDLSKTDHELLKLRAAKMSTKTIAMLMGGRWTEARVYNRLAEIDGQVASVLPDLSADRADEPPPPPVIDLLPRTAPWPVEPKVVLVSNPTSAPWDPTPWMRQALSYAADPEAPRDSVLIIAAEASGKSQFALAWPVEEEPCLETLPPPLVVDEAPATDECAAQPAAEATTAPPEPQDAVADPAPPTPPAPNILATVAAPIVPSQAKAARKPRAIAAEAANLLAAPVPPLLARAPGRAMRLRPLTERIAGYALRFHAARWPVDEIAELFDVSPETLALVLA